jgi:predicted site-specific integrase-resolvase
MRGYLSVRETAEKWGVSVRWVNQYILNGRIPGVERLGKSWAIPENADKPTKQKSGPKPQKTSNKNL